MLVDQGFQEFTVIVVFFHPSLIIAILVFLDGAAQRQSFIGGNDELRVFKYSIHAVISTVTQKFGKDKKPASKS